jgi:hypothetical protein
VQVTRPSTVSTFTYSADTSGSVSIDILTFVATHASGMAAANAGPVDASANPTTRVGISQR